MHAVKDWENVTIAAFRAMSSTRYAEAAELWGSADMLLSSAEPDDPRRVASLNNQGLSYALTGKRESALSALAEAALLWTEMSSRVATMTIPLVGGSSSFHFRLASKNLAAFEGARRRPYEKLCAAGLAISRFNRLLLREPAASTAPIATSAASLADLLADVFGPCAPDVRLLSDATTRAADDQAYSPYGDKIVAFEQRLQSMSPAISQDCRRLDTALALTALLSPYLALTLPASTTEPSTHAPSAAIQSSSQAT